jgi:transglutaminase-like putative cysteine protease
MPPLTTTPPAAARGRGSWRLGLLVFTVALFVLTGGALLSLLWQEDGKAEPRPPPSDESPRYAARRTTLPLRNSLRPPPDWTPFDALTATNLSPATGTARPLDATPPTRSGFRLLAEDAARMLPTNAPPARSTTGLPVFQALRASRGQPIPKEIIALANEITRNCTTDAERAKAIYDWITSHITYDWKVWADMVAGAGSYTQPQDPWSVVQRGTGVCAGYAWLFNALAGSVGIPADFVIGDVRGYRGTTDDALVNKFQHAWNSVKIGDQWYLMDATWGARQNGESDSDYLARRDYYYQTPANQLIFDHRPETTEWQLLANPVTDEAFRALPNLKPAFFRDNLRLGNAFADTLTTPAEQPASVIVIAPQSILLTATLSRNGQDISAGKLSLRESGTRRDVIIAALPTGEYILRLYSKPAAQAGPYECAVDYLITVGGS